MAKKSTQAELDESTVLLAMGLTLAHLGGNLSDEARTEMVTEALTNAKAFTSRGQIVAAGIFYTNANSLPLDRLEEVRSFILHALTLRAGNVGDKREELFEKIAQGVTAMWDLDFQRAHAQMGTRHARTDFIGDLLFAASLEATETLPLGSRLTLFSSAIERFSELGTDVPPSLVNTKSIFESWTRGLVPASAGQDVVAPTAPSSPAL